MSCECQLHAKITVNTRLQLPTAWRQPSSGTIKANVKATLPRPPNPCYVTLLHCSRMPKSACGLTFKTPQISLQPNSTDSKKEILWPFNVYGKNNTYIGLKVGCPIFSSGFSQISDAEKTKCMAMSRELNSGQNHNGT
jgi:hypothetical protein